MPDDEEKEIPPEKEDELTDDIYGTLVTEEDELQGDALEEEERQNLSEAELTGGHDSDLVSIIKRLLPSFTDTEIDEIDITARALMVSRISPDMFVEQMYLTVVSIIERHARDGIENNKKPIDVMLVINVIYSVCSMALEGKVRVELVELAGSAKDSEELEKISKGLGFG